MHRPNTEQKKIRRKILLWCEGETEEIFLKHYKNHVRIDSYEDCTIEVDHAKASDTNVERLFNIAIKKLHQKEYELIVVIHDRDKPSNTEQQLQKCKDYLKQYKNNLSGVISVPCFEIIFLINFNNNCVHDTFPNNELVIDKLNGELKKRYPRANKERSKHPPYYYCREIKADSEYFKKHIFSLFDFEKTMRILHDNNDLYKNYSDIYNIMTLKL